MGYYESPAALNEKFREKGIPGVKIETVNEGLETEFILDLVDIGQIKTTVADSHLAHIWSGVLENLKIHDGLKVRSDGSIAWMVRKESPCLRESLNSFLSTRRKGTKLGNIYFNRYFKDHKWVERRLTKKRLKRIQKYLPAFKKYAAMHDIPWLFTLSSYNAGLANVTRARKRRRGGTWTRTAGSRTSRS